MTPAQRYGQLKEQLALYWLARTEQERKYLTVGGAVAIVALVYGVFIDPALTGRAKLQRDLPQLRQQAAQLQSLAAEAAELNRQPVAQVTPMTRESLTASLATRSIVPGSLTVAGESAKLQLSNVSFANLYAWLDAQRRENRIAVDEGTVTALPAAGQVDASLTLRQTLDAGAAGR
ncbi:MAG: type II secretion system protein GspM [Gammaproteobacteria bacterium]